MNVKRKMPLSCSSMAKKNRPCEKTKTIRKIYQNSFLLSTTQEETK